MDDNWSSRDRKALGAYGETLAAEYLLGLGWTIIARNWRCPEGELDIVASEPGFGVVVCEVKSRTGLGFGVPLEAITHAKLRKLRLLTRRWLSECADGYPAVRMDAIGILLTRGQPPHLTHIRGIVP